MIIEVTIAVVSVVVATAAIAYAVVADRKFKRKLTAIAAQSAIAEKIIRGELDKVSQKTIWLGGRTW